MKTVVITGATSGIGLAVCNKCLENGYRVIGIGRSSEKIKQILEKHDQSVLDGQLVFFKADLMEPSEVQRVGNLIKAFLDEHAEGNLYALINNAGCVRSWYSTNSRGYEHQFALNHLGSFYLTHLLFPCLLKAKGRILMTSSQSHKNTVMHWNDLMFENHYRPLLAYKQSKLANMLFAFSLNQKYENTGIRAYGIDPGLVNTSIGLKNTGGLVHFFWNIRMRYGVSADVPAKTYIYLLDQNPALKALYFHDSKPIKSSKQVNAPNANRLFQLSERLCGITFGGEQ